MATATQQWLKRLGALPIAAASNANQQISTSRQVKHLKPP